MAHFQNNMTFVCRLTVWLVDCQVGWLSVWLLDWAAGLSGWLTIHLSVIQVPLVLLTSHHELFTPQHTTIRLHINLDPNHGYSDHWSCCCCDLYGSSSFSLMLLSLIQKGSVIQTFKKGIKSRNLCPVQCASGNVFTSVYAYNFVKVKSCYNCMYNCIV